mgnify:CR=1 FL=1
MRLKLTQHLMFFSPWEKILIIKMHTLGSKIWTNSSSECCSSVRTNTHAIDFCSYANLRQANGSKYNLIYSTPSCYLKAVHDANQKFVEKTDDFFPYSSDGNSFWTGYFTSRPTLKRFERQANNFLQVCKQVYALDDLGPEDWVDLNSLREAMGIMQHHDAITGTEKQHVADDYARILQEGINECQFIVNSALR